MALCKYIHLEFDKMEHRDLSSLAQLLNPMLLWGQNHYLDSKTRKSALNSEKFHWVFRSILLNSTQWPRMTPKFHTSGPHLSPKFQTVLLIIHHIFIWMFHRQLKFNMTTIFFKKKKSNQFLRANYILQKWFEGRWKPLHLS